MTRPECPDDQVKDARMVYRELRERGGVPVVFLHHLTAVLDDWDPVRTASPAATTLQT